MTRLDRIARALPVMILLLSGLQTLTAQAQPTLKFIDAHVHLIGGRGGNTDYDGAVKVAIEHMDRFGIRTAIVMPPPQIASQDWQDYPAFAHALRRHPNRFAFAGGGGELNARLHRYADPSSVTDEVKRSFAETAHEIITAGAAGFGEMASLHISAVPGHPFEYVPADHPLLRVLADVAAGLDVPIDLHMDAVAEASQPPARFAGGDNPSVLPPTLTSLRRLLAYNRQAKIVWAHGGSDPIGAMTPAFIGRLMDEYPNLYVSLRVVGGRAPMSNKLLAFGEIESEWRELLIRHSARFVIGTDSFFVAPSLQGSGPGMKFAQRNVPKLKATRYFLSLLPEDVARKIAKDNALRLYNRLQ